MSRVSRNVIAAVALAAATAGAWAAWLAWESGYHTDAAGVTSGPYAWWQVAGCVLTLGVLAALAATRLNPLVIAPVMAVALTIPWSIKASDDQTGLWAVGAAMVLIGTALGSGLVSGVVWLVRRSSPGGTDR